MQELVQLTWAFSRSFSIASFSMLDGPGGILFHSEVNLSIQHITVQDQDGQNKIFKGTIESSNV